MAPWFRLASLLALVYLAAEYIPGLTWKLVTCAGLVAWYVGYVLGLVTRLAYGPILNEIDDRLRRLEERKDSRHEAA